MTLTKKIEGDWQNTYDECGKLVSMKLSEEAYPRVCWFVRDPYDVMTECGYTITKENAHLIKDFIDGEYIDTLHWFTAACWDKKQANEVVKWMVGPLKELQVYTGGQSKIGETTVGRPNLKTLKFTAVDFGIFVSKVTDKTITATMGKEVLRRLFKGEELEKILEDDQFKVSSGDEVEKIIDEVIATNPSQVEEVKGGNEKILGWLVGQIMKASRGKANAAEAKETLKEKLGI